MSSLYPGVSENSTLRLVDPLIEAFRGHATNKGQPSHSFHRGTEQFARSLFSLYVEYGLAANTPMRPSLHRCLERLEKSVSPFGPSGNRLSQHLKRAGEHLTILAGLAGAAKHLGDELGSWSADRVRPSCAAAVTRLNGGCAACERTTPAHVCRDACANAARGCLTPRYVTLYGPVSAYAKRLLRSVKGVKGELRYDSLYVRLTLEVRMALEHAQDNAQHIFKQVNIYKSNQSLI